MRNIDVLVSILFTLIVISVLSYLDSKDRRTFELKKLCVQSVSSVCDNLK